MKKVFLSLAVVAALTVVSCKQAEATDAAAADTTVVVEPTADTTVVVADTTATDTTVVAPEAK